MSKRKKIAYFISSVDFSYGIKWLAEFMPREKYDITFFFLYHKEPQLVSIFNAEKINSYYIPYQNKYDLIKVIPKIFKLLLKIKPDVVHAHLFDACIASLIPAYILRVPLRLHTRHHSMIHHDSFPHAIKYDKLNNFLSHKIIAISQNVLNILIEKENVSTAKVKLLHHGFNFVEMLSFNKNREYISTKYNLNNNAPIIGVISRFTEFKGIQYIIPAFKKMLTQYPNAVLIMANAVGDYKSNILEMCADMDVKNYRIIEFEKNVFDLYACFDVFVHVPVDEYVEAFGQIYIEAMAIEIPSIFTLSGVASEYIQNMKNALVVDFKNSEQIYDAIIYALTHPEIITKIVEKGKKDVFEMFDVSQMILLLEEIYET